MKIVFEFYGKHPQASATADAYSCGRVDEPPQWRGFRAEVLIVDCLDWESDEKRREGDCLHIEGDGEAVKAALTAALRLLEINEQHARDHVMKEIARTRICPSCGTYADALNPWHGDGKGNACYGLLDQRKALVQAEQPAKELGVSKNRALVVIHAADNAPRCSPNPSAANCSPRRSGGNDADRTTGSSGEHD